MEGSPQPQAAAPAQADAPTQATEQPTARELADADYDALAKIKYNGREEKLSVRKLQELAQKGFMADQKASKADLTIKEMTELRSLAKKDLAAFLKKEGIDPDRWAEDYVLSKYEQDQLTPEQKELRELKKFKEDQDREKEEREKTEKQKREEQEHFEISKKIGDEIEAALRQTSVKPSRYVVAQMAHLLESALTQKKNLSALEAARMIERASTQQMFDELTSLDEAAIAALPKEFLQKIQKYLVSRVGKSPPTASTNARSGAVPVPSKKQVQPKNLTAHEWKQQIRKRFGS